VEVWQARRERGNRAAACLRRRAAARRATRAAAAAALCAALSPVTRAVTVYTSLEMGWQVMV